MGRDAADVETAAWCLLDDPGEEDPRKLARAHLLAFGLLDLHCIAVSLGVKG